MGLVVGDALGVPVEFADRNELEKNPVTAMRSFGTHNQPKGTWSDDSSMTIATMEFICERTDVEYDYSELMDKFVAWLCYGEYTPYGETFDKGVATTKAIMNYLRGMHPLECGGETEWDNGNGSLMRILPVSLKLADSVADSSIPEFAIERIRIISSLTHAHTRSVLACLIYSKIVAMIMYHPYESIGTIIKMSISSIHNDLVENAIKFGKEIIDEIHTYDRLWDIDNFVNLPEEAIKSSGYVVDTLEAAIWCFANSNSYSESVLKAVNLGRDTDTVGAVTGGLAGLFYGYEAIPEEWRMIIPKRDWIENLAGHILTGI